ncbi:hypothetical protein D1872_212910 [compost metagenome]
MNARIRPQRNRKIILFRIFANKPVLDRFTRFHEQNRAGSGILMHFHAVQLLQQIGGDIQNPLLFLRSKAQAHRLVIDFSRLLIGFQQN